MPKNKTWYVFVSESSLPKLEKSESKIRSIFERGDQILVAGSF